MHKSVVTGAIAVILIGGVPGLWRRLVIYRHGCQGHGITSLVRSKMRPLPLFPLHPLKPFRLLPYLYRLPHTTPKNRIL